MKKLKLGSTLLNGSVRIQKGDQVIPINSKNFGVIEKRIQEYLNNKLLEEVGVPPYEVLEIFYCFEEPERTLLTIIGENKKRRNVSKINFEKY